MDKDTKTELDYLLPDKAYEILKWVALIALPAVAWLVGVVGPQWGVASLRRDRHDHQRRRRFRRRSDRREPAHGHQAGR